MFRIGGEQYAPNRFIRGLNTPLILDQYFWSLKTKIFFFGNRTVLFLEPVNERILFSGFGSQIKNTFSGANSTAIGFEFL